MEVVTDIHMVLEQLAAMRETLLPLYFITKAIFLMYSLDLRYDNSAGSFLHRLFLRACFDRFLFERGVVSK